MWFPQQQNVTTGLEFIKGLPCAGSLDNLEDVEANGLAQRTALSDGDDVSQCDVAKYCWSKRRKSVYQAQQVCTMLWRTYSPEGGRAVNGHVLVTLLVTAVLLDEVQVVPSDNDRARHLVLDDDAGENAAADGDVAGERALLVDERTLDGLQNKDWVQIAVADAVAEISKNLHRAAS